MSHCLTPSRLNLGNHGLRCGTATTTAIDSPTEVIDNNLCTPSRQLNCVAATQAITCTGNDRYLTVITNCHSVTSSLTLFILLSDELHTQPLCIERRRFFTFYFHGDTGFDQKAIRVLAIDT